jgi:YidC/Oxa1 family membrane protein insertase
MDKNTIIGLVLMLCVAIAFPFLSTIGSEPVPQNVETVETKTEQVDATVDESKTNVAPIVADSSALFFAAKQPNYQEAVILDNGKVQLVIDPKGGMIARANLPEYCSYEHYKAGMDAPLFLFDETNSEMNFSFETKEDILSL